MARSVAVLGSTGSVGRQTLEVADHLGIKVCALASAGGNLDLLIEQTLKYRPEIVSIEDAAKARAFSKALSGGAYDISAQPGGGRIEVMSGPDGLCAAASQTGAEMTVAAISGEAGLPAAMAAIKAGKVLALANKETLVSAGRIVTDLSRKHKVPIIPVDSEHSAIFQALGGRGIDEVKRLILTASGGPFRNMKASDLAGVTPEQACVHPTFRMGRKVSIDSSTLMNKGLEVIEAAWLFGAPPEKIDVLIHPQSVIHSMVEFRDNTVIAQMGAPDMRAPIQSALTHPKKFESLAKPLDFTQTGCLTFEKPDVERFPCLSYAYDALGIGGTMPTVYNAANEAAVGLFCDRAIKYADIAVLIYNAMSRHIPKSDAALENIFEASREARAGVMRDASLRRR